MSGQWHKERVVGILAVTQVIAWGSVYYAFSVLAPEIQHELGWRAEWVYGAYSWSLLVAAALSTPAGVLLDRIGGRVMMGAGSLTASTGLMVLSAVDSVPGYLFAWTILGAAMALTLYEAAFATVNREILADARKAISILTLFGGFASTVFWPLTLHLSSDFGWRETYLAYGLLHLFVCLPLHLMLPVRKAVQGVRFEGSSERSDYTLREALRHAAFWKLAFAFAANAFVFAALSVHLIPMLNRFGHPMVLAVTFAALIGPTQVLGRIGELVFADRVRPQAVGNITFATLPAALLGLVLAGEQQWIAAGFCMLYGLGNGILTIVRGTVPQAMFGRENYGAIAGALAGPSLIAKAAAPLAMAALLQGAADWRVPLYILLAFALVSLLLYVAATRTERTTRLATLAQDMSGR